jgi:FixJ family two-component response regulator
LGRAGPPARQTAGQARPPEPAAQQRHQRRHQESPDDQGVQQQPDPDMQGDSYLDPAVTSRVHSNAEIAEELCISELTVKSHIGRIFVKLDLRDRAAAIVCAYDHGLVTRRYPT